MKQVVQDKRSGDVKVQDVPTPMIREGTLLVRTAASLISSGTERAALDLGRKSLLGKAMDRPDLVTKVLDVVRTRGIMDAVHAVTSRLDEPTLLGYSSAGVVIGVGPGVNGFAPGDRVACAGYGHASHAEFVTVPSNLAVPIPGDVPFEHACFVALGAIALHGVRQARAQVGDNALVIGLGLVGLLTVQILKASGCRVIGVDLSSARCELAAQLGATAVFQVNENTASEVLQATSGRGADICLVTAATKSSDPMVLAGQVARDRAVICVVGDVGMEIPRKLYYEKELSVYLSRSYGPGRYDSRYEEEGIDYPVGYVRWTERHNMQAFLELVAGGAVRIQSLITKTYSIDQAVDAYAALTNRDGGRVLALLLTYPQDTPLTARQQIPSSQRAVGGFPTVSFVGAGSFARSVLLPHFRAAGVALRGVATATGTSAAQTAQRFGFAFATTNAEEVIADKSTNAVVIATRHDSHASLVTRALAACKHVFVEKPLALTREELDSVLDAAEQSDRVLFVGYNRRFARLAIAIKKEIMPRRGPIALVYRVNAGLLPPSHWTRDSKVGGGRIVGEACHFVDLMQYLTDEDPVAVTAYGVPPVDGGSRDTVSFQVRFAGGSIGTVHYFSVGDRALPKERLEIMTTGFTAVLDDFRLLELYKGGRRRRMRSWRQNKGHAEEVQAFLGACRGDGTLRPSLRSLALTSLVTFAVETALRTNGEVTVESTATGPAI